MKTNHRPVIWATLAFCLAPPLLAQTSIPNVPEAGDPRYDAEALRREDSRERDYYQVLEEREQMPFPVIEEPLGANNDSLPDNGPSFLLRELRFAQSVFLSEAELTEIAQPYLDHEVNFGDLNVIAAAINELYRSREIYTARAFIPPQTIEQGTVEVMLVEGRLGEVSLSGSRYTADSFLRSQLPLDEGSVIDLPALAKTLRYFNAGNEVKMSVALRPGTAFGQTNVVMNVSEPSRNRFQMFSSNDGSRSTGREQVGAVVVHNDLFGRADQATVFLSAAEGTVSGNLNYSLAVNRWGGRVGASFSRSRIEVIQGGYEDLDITGSSERWEVEYSQPLWVTDDWSLTGRSSIADIHSETELESLGVQLNDSDNRSATLGLDLRWAGDGYQGRAFQNVEVMKAEQALVEEQDVTLYRGGASWLQRTSDRTYLLAIAGWQFASEEAVPSSALYQLGGVATVRGYDQGVLSGSEGYSLNLGWHWQWTEELSPFVFADQGAVYSVSPEHEEITSAGVGLEWRWGEAWRGHLTYGHALDEVLPDQKFDQFHARFVWSLDR